MNRWRTSAGRYLPGLLASVVVAIAARSLASQYDAPVMLFALLLGMAMNFLSADGPCKPGIDLAARGVLRLGVALLGTRITLEQIAALGWHPVLVVVVSVVATIVVSMLVARAMGFNVLFGLLSGGATAICGASAALALAAALPAHPGKERATLFTVIGVSALSTAAMIVYPVIVRALGLDPIDAGVFIGGTIHDVAQVVGAGYSLSHEIGDTATVVKLLRVAMLLPVILVAVMITRTRGGHDSGERPPLLPWFAVAFFGLAVLGSLGVIPAPLQQFGSNLSTWCLVTAIAALGMKIQIRELTRVGIKPVLLMLGETAFLAALVLGLLWLGV
ncbi:YeiH family protein [Pseudoxanthomonas koreensis]|uniref:YeiH family protein n=1 Tax=Pseudoxanthomonas koreensis TaxID=266061 RepID=UPI0013916BBE|nr:putative sulfate exporter family transporter [Pseudoxanthomonas koreensis]KAF1697679.1 putative sulfate exporter family transporter [Pseudoxanthomonas koreensis]